MNRNPHITILLSYLLVILCACSALILVSFKSKSHRLFKVPAIVNYVKGAPICLAPNFMMVADHSIERIERFDDTLDLGKQPKWNKEKYYTVNVASEPEDYFNDGGIKVIVDTQHEIGVTVRPGMPAVQGFPVYIANQAKHRTAKIETHNSKLNMVVEAYTTKNTWEPIEYVPASSNKQSDYVLSLPPQHYAFTSNIIHCGDHVSRCRVKLTSGDNVYYSNIFWMGINYTQFEKI